MIFLFSGQGIPAIQLEHVQDLLIGMCGIYVYRDIMFEK
jgi:hypothetical protein